METKGGSQVNEGLLKVPRAQRINWVTGLIIHTIQSIRYNCPAVNHIFSSVFMGTVKQLKRHLETVSVVFHWTAIDTEISIKTTINMWGWEDQPESLNDRITIVLYAINQYLIHVWTKVYEQKQQVVVFDRVLWLWTHLNRSHSGKATFSSLLNYHIFLFYTLLMLDMRQLHKLELGKILRERWRDQNSSNTCSI